MQSYLQSSSTECFIAQGHGKQNKQNKWKCKKSIFCCFEQMPNASHVVLSYKSQFVFLNHESQRSLSTKKWVRASKPRGWSNNIFELN